MLNSGTTVEHVKVSRNDGSGYADYLLDVHQDFIHFD